jgi:hypothetical protein
MKYVLAVVCLSFCIGVSGLQPVFGKDAPNSESQLLQDFETALKAKDKDAVLSLFNQKGVSSWICVVGFLGYVVRAVRCRNAQPQGNL